ncbi:hypothetical protein NHJ13734_006823 [Beauveria thailandica]
MMESDECGSICALLQAQTKHVTGAQAATHSPDITASTLGLVAGDAPPSTVTDPDGVPLFSSLPAAPLLSSFPFSHYPLSDECTVSAALSACTSASTTTSTNPVSKPFAVRPSPTGGMGVFATRHLLPDEIILEEAPLLTSSRGGNSISIFEAYARASRKKQKKAMKLHASRHFKPGTPYLQAIWDTNSFAISPLEAGLFPLAARFNHACEPANNVYYAYDATRRRMRFWVAPEGGGGVAEGEELTICYGRGKTPGLLYRWYGFRCGCGACEGVSEQEMGSFEVIW